MVKGEKDKIIKIPDGLTPDNMVRFDHFIYISAHNHETFCIYKLDTEKGSLAKLLTFSYPYGETTFDNSNTAFYLRGQFGDSIYEISNIKQGKDGKLWVTDLLSGRLFIINNK